jgi:hypothetical protein
VTCLPPFNYICEGGGETYVLVHGTGESNISIHRFGVPFANKIPELVLAILRPPNYPSNSIKQGFIF